MTAKIFSIKSEGDMELVLKEFTRLAKSKVKKKTVNIRISTEALSKIVIHNVNNQFKDSQLGIPSDFHVHFFIEE